METVYIGLGSNVGDGKANLREAASRIAQIEGVSLCKVSSLYFTEPVGVPTQPWYCNAVLEVATSLEPEELLTLLQEIETRMGRTGKGEGLPRPIDIDILLFGARHVKKEGLEIPHPRLLDRRFALEPLVEITGDIICPGANGSAAEYMDRIDGSPVVVRKGLFYE